MTVELVIAAFCPLLANSLVKKKRWTIRNPPFSQKGANINRALALTQALMLKN